MSLNPTGAADGSRFRRPDLKGKQEKRYSLFKVVQRCFCRLQRVVHGNLPQLLKDIVRCLSVTEANE